MKKIRPKPTSTTIAAAQTLVLAACLLIQQIKAVIYLTGYPNPTTYGPNDTVDIAVTDYFNLSKADPATLKIVLYRVDQNKSKNFSPLLGANLPIDQVNFPAGTASLVRPLTFYQMGGILNFNSLFVVNVNRNGNKFLSNSVALVGDGTLRCHDMTAMNRVYERDMTLNLSVVCLSDGRSKASPGKMLMGLYTMSQNLTQTEPAVDVTLTSDQYFPSVAGLAMMRIYYNRSYIRFLVAFNRQPYNATAVNDKVQAFIKTKRNFTSLGQLQLVFKNGSNSAFQTIYSMFTFQGLYQNARQRLLVLAKRKSSPNLTLTNCTYLRTAPKNLVCSEPMVQLPVTNGFAYVYRYDRLVTIPYANPPTSGTVKLPYTIWSINRRTFELTIIFKGTFVYNGTDFPAGVWPIRFSSNGFVDQLHFHSPASYGQEYGQVSYYRGPKTAQYSIVSLSANVKASTVSVISNEIVTCGLFRRRGPYYTFNASLLPNYAPDSTLYLNLSVSDKDSSYVISFPIFQVANPFGFSFKNFIPGYYDVYEDGMVNVPFGRLFMQKYNNLTYRVHGDPSQNLTVNNIDDAAGFTQKFVTLKGLPSYFNGTRLSYYSKFYPYYAFIYSSRQRAIHYMTCDYPNNGAEIRCTNAANATLSKYYGLGLVRLNIGNIVINSLTTRSTRVNAAFLIWTKNQGQTGWNTTIVDAQCSSITVAQFDFVFGQGIYYRSGSVLYLLNTTSLTTSVVADMSQYFPYFYFDFHDQTRNIYYYGTTDADSYLVYNLDTKKLTEFPRKLHDNYFREGIDNHYLTIDGRYMTLYKSEPLSFEFKQLAIGNAQFVSRYQSSFDDQQRIVLYSSRVPIGPPGPGPQRTVQAYSVLQFDRQLNVFNPIRLLNRNDSNIRRGITSAFIVDGKAYLIPSYNQTFGTPFSAYSYDVNHRGWFATPYFSAPLTKAVPQDLYLNASSNATGASKTFKVKMVVRPKPKPCNLEIQRNWPYKRGRVSIEDYVQINGAIFAARAVNKAPGVKVLGRIRDQGSFQLPNFNQNGAIHRLQGNLSSGIALYKGAPGEVDGLALIDNGKVIYTYTAMNIDSFSFVKFNWKSKFSNTTGPRWVITYQTNVANRKQGLAFIYNGNRAGEALPIPGERCDKMRAVLNENSGTMTPEVLLFCLNKVTNRLDFINFSGIEFLTPFLYASFHNVLDFDVALQLKTVYLYNVIGARSGIDRVSITRAKYNRTIKTTKITPMQNYDYFYSSIAVTPTAAGTNLLAINTKGTVVMLVQDNVGSSLEGLGQGIQAVRLNKVKSYDGDQRIAVTKQYTALLVNKFGVGSDTKIFVWQNQFGTASAQIDLYSAITIGQLRQLRQFGGAPAIVDVDFQLYNTPTGITEVLVTTTNPFRPLHAYQIGTLSANVLFVETDLSRAYVAIEGPYNKKTIDLYTLLRTGANLSQESGEKAIEEEKELDEDQEVEEVKEECPQPKAKNTRMYIQFEE